MHNNYNKINNNNNGYAVENITGSLFIASSENGDGSNNLIFFGWHATVTESEQKPFFFIAVCIFVRIRNRCSTVNKGTLKQQISFPRWYNP